VNKYIVTTEPWVLAKSDGTRLATVMNHIVESLKIISVLIWPVMPETAEKIQDLLGLPKKGKHLGLQDIREWGRVKPSRTIAKAPHLFQRIGPGSTKEGPDKKKLEKKKEVRDQRSEIRGQRPAQRGLAQGKQIQEKTEEPLKGTISLEAFQELDIRIGTVKNAEAIPGSKKLFKLTVDIGEERTIVAGLAGLYSEPDLVGKQVVVVANLEPVMLMGVESNGMVLAAEDKSGVHLLALDAPTRPGSKVR